MGMPGRKPRRPGAAMCTTRLSCPQRLHRQQTRTIALTGIRIGRPAGQWARRNGAAECMAKVAPGPVAAVLPHHRPLTAKPDSQIGWLDGASRKRRGVAKMSVKVAHQRLGDALEQVVE